MIKTTKYSSAFLILAGVEAIRFDNQHGRQPILYANSDCTGDNVILDEETLSTNHYLVGFNVNLKNNAPIKSYRGGDYRLDFYMGQETVIEPSETTDGCMNYVGSKQPTLIQKLPKKIVTNDGLSVWRQCQQVTYKFGKNNNNMFRLSINAVFHSICFFHFLEC